MPMITFACTKCHKEIKKFFTKASGISSELDCECGDGKLERQLGAPSSKSTQVVDNGHQARQTEIMNEVVEKERDRLYNGD